MESWALMTFLTILILVFSFFMLLTGAFTAYFGSGKSRKVGAGLLGAGLALGLVWGVLIGMLSLAGEVRVLEVVFQALGVILAALIGAGAAIALFLLAIMKS